MRVAWCAMPMGIPPLAVNIYRSLTGDPVPIGSLWQAIAMLGGAGMLVFVVIGGVELIRSSLRDRNAVVDSDYVAPGWVTRAAPLGLFVSYLFLGVGLLWLLTRLGFAVTPGIWPKVAVACALAAFSRKELQKRNWTHITVLALAIVCLLLFGDRLLLRYYGR